MIKRKSNKVLMILLAIILILNTLSFGFGEAKTKSSALKSSCMSAGWSDSVQVQRGSSDISIDAMETALVYGHSHQYTLDKMISANVLNFRANLQNNIIKANNRSNITIDKKASPIKINAPPIMKDNSKIL